MANINAPKGLLESLDHIGLEVAEYIANGFHAAPAAGAVGQKIVPSRHRLFNATAGIGAFIIGRQLMNILVGETPKGKKIDKEKLPFFLQPLHGILAYNRYADDPKNQWMRVFDDLFPAALGSIGAIYGSEYFFAAEENAINKSVKLLNEKEPGIFTKNVRTRAEIMKDTSLTMAAKEDYASLQQAKTWRVLSGIAGIFSASSGLALIAMPFNFLNYGVALNKAFLLAARRKEFVGLAEISGIDAFRTLSNTQSKTVYGPSAAIPSMINNVSRGEGYGTKIINVERIRQFTNAILKPWFKDVTPAQIERFQEIVKEQVEQAIKQKKDPAETTKLIRERLEKLLNGKDLEKTLRSIGLDPDKAAFGSNGFAGWIGDRPKVAAGAVGGMLAGAIGVTALHDAKKGAGGPLAGDGGGASQGVHAGGNPITRFFNGPVLHFARWLGDSVLNVPPQNRFFSALGLSLGLLVGCRGMRALTGREFNGVPITADKVDTLIRPLYGKFKFDYFGSDSVNRWKRILMWSVPTVTGFFGVLAGSKFAFRKQYKELEHPEFLEDYSAKIALSQGDQWSFLSASSAMLASSSGVSNLPIPGINYAIGLSTRSVLSYDKRTSMPILGKFWSNNESTYYHGLKGLLDLTILYSVRNPSKDPEELHSLAHATLAPMFKDVTPEQTQAYVDHIQAVRMKYWQEGGISEANAAKAETELRGILRGAGFEKTLESLGLDPARVTFDNGMAGKIANTIGAKGRVETLIGEYREKYQERKKERSAAAPQPAAAAPVEDIVSLPASLAPTPQTVQQAAQGGGHHERPLNAGDLKTLKPFQPGNIAPAQPAASVLSGRGERPAAAYAAQSPAASHISRLLSASKERDGTPAPATAHLM